MKYTLAAGIIIVGIILIFTGQEGVANFGWFCIGGGIIAFPVFICGEKTITKRDSHLGDYGKTWGAVANNREVLRERQIRTNQMASANRHDRLNRQQRKK